MQHRTKCSKNNNNNLNAQINQFLQYRTIILSENSLELYNEQSI